MAKTDWAKVHEAAHEAGMAAGEAARPTPMVVVQRENPWDDSSPVVRQYAPVMDGVCGFAYVTVRPGTSSFAKWLKVHNHGFKAYYGGVQFSVRAFNQSYEQKVAYARAYAAEVNKVGVAAYVESRVD